MTTSIRLEDLPGSPVVRLVGAVDMRSVADRAGELYSHTHDRDVTVDLAEVADIDGPALTVLLMTLRAATSVQLVNVPPVVRGLVGASDAAETLRFDAA